MPTDNKRTKMIHVYTPSSGTYRVEVERETLRSYDDGNAFPIPAGARLVRRDFEAIKDNSVPGGPVTVTTYDDLRTLLSACADALADEDEQAEAAAAVAQ